MPGGPGGSLAVELSESIEREGYLHAAVVRSDSWQQPTPSVELPPGRILLLSARGGTGENGHSGGDGQSGLAGVDGLAATRDTDATVRPSQSEYQVDANGCLQEWR